MSDEAPPDRIDDLFHQAVELTSDERRAFLDTACGGDAELRAEIERLLNAHDHAQQLPRFLSSQATENHAFGLDKQRREGVTVGDNANASSKSFGCLPGTDSSRFRILRFLDEGGLGKVSVALDSELGREVAFKEIRDRFADDLSCQSRFLLEAEVTGRLEHPGVVPVYALGRFDNGRPYYAMRLIRGETLAEAGTKLHQKDYDREKKRVGLRRLIERFLDVCDAVGYAHARGIIHRDLKPSNVMLGKFGETLVLDWGLTKSLEHRDKPEDFDEDTLRPDSGSGSAPTAYGKAIGSPQYMSPEQAAGKLDEIGPATDVFGLGATLYHVLCGAPPIVTESREAILDKAMRGDFPAPRERNPDVPIALEAICIKAMAVNPQDRYSNVLQLRAAIQEWLDNEPITNLLTTVKRFENLLAAHPDQAEYAERLGRELCITSKVLQSLARYEESLKFADDAVGVLVDLFQRNPSNLWCFEELSLARNQLVDVLRASGRENEALQFEEANKVDLQRVIDQLYKTREGHKELFRMTLHLGASPAEAEQLVAPQGLWHAVEVETPQDSEPAEAKRVVGPEHAVFWGTLDVETPQDSEINVVLPGKSEPSPIDPPDISLIRSRDVPPEYARRKSSGIYRGYGSSPGLGSSPAAGGDRESFHLLIGRRSLGRIGEPGHADYKLNDVLGQGEMGTVWSARQMSLDREVAIKIPRPTAGETSWDRRLFMSEALITAKLSHPNIVPIYDLARNESGQLFCSMKRIEGRSWDTWMHKKGLAQGDNIDILMKVCDAVRFAHANNVLHRDVKPQNVMVGHFGEVSVMDWGIAMILPEGRPQGRMIRPAGTPAYMAPEMATGNMDEIGRHTDVYLLGAVLFEIITGEPPHPAPADEGDTSDQLQASLLIAARNVITPSKETGELIDIAYKAMATNTYDRFQTVEEFQAAIRDYLKHPECNALTEKGDMYLARAKEARSDPYEDYARARFAFEDALYISPENAKARSGLAQATHDCARCALTNGDYKLGLSVLDPKQPAHAELFYQLRKAKRSSERKRLIASVVVIVVICLLILGLVGVSIFALRESAARKSPQASALRRTSTASTNQHL